MEILASSIFSVMVSFIIGFITGILASSDLIRFKFEKSIRTLFRRPLISVHPMNRVIIEVKKDTNSIFIKSGICEAI